jgi:hypothetical protein
MEKNPDPESATPPSAIRTFDNNLSVELEHVEFLGVGVASVRDHRHQGKPKK